MTQPQNQNYHISTTQSVTINQQSVLKDQKCEYNPILEQQFIKTSHLTETQIQFSPYNINCFYRQFFSHQYSNDKKFNLTQILYQRKNEFISYGINYNKLTLSLIKKVFKSQSMKVLSYIVSFAKFDVLVKIYNENQTYFDEMIQTQGVILGKGAQGCVFKIPLMDGVLKQISFDPNSSSLSKTIKKVLSQFAISKVVSCFRIGPKVLRPYMFDMICTGRNIYFFLEECISFKQGVKMLFQVNPDKDINKIIEQSLKDSLFLLHNLKIIHYDIKPENIMWSPSYKKFVFIDYGLSDGKVYFQGIMQKETFKGTFSYCSEDMKRLISSRVQMYVDVYFNDCYCLEKVINIFRQQVDIIVNKLNQDNEYDINENKINQQSIEGDKQSQFSNKSYQQSLQSQHFLFYRKIQRILELQKYSVDVQVNKRYLNKLNFIMLTYMIYRKNQQNLNTYYEKYYLEVEANKGTYLNLFFQFLNQIYSSRVFTSFINIFFPKELLQANKESQRFNNSTLISTKLNHLPQQENSFLIKTLDKYPFLLPYYKLFSHQRLSSIETIQSIFKKIQTKVNFQYKKPTNQEPLSKNQIQLKSFEYLFFLYDIFLQLNVEINFLKFYNSLQQLQSYLDRLASKCPAFIEKFLQLKKSISIYQKLSIIKQTLTLILAIISNCDIKILIKPFQYNRRLIYLYSDFQRLCNVLGCNDLLHQIELIQKSQMKSIYFSQFEQLNVKIKLTLSRSIQQLSIQQINKVLCAIQVVMLQVVHHIQNILDQFVQSILTGDTAIIEKVSLVNNQYLLKFQQESEKFNNFIQTLSTKGIIIQLSQAHPNLTKNLTSFIKDTLIRETIILYKKIQEIVNKMFFNQPLPDIEKVFLLIQQMNIMMKKNKEFKKFILHYGKIQFMIENILVSCYFQNGCYYKMMEIKQKRIQYLIEEQNQIKQMNVVNQNIFYRYLCPLQELYNLFGFKNKIKHLQKVKKSFQSFQQKFKLQDQQLNYQSIPISLNTPQNVEQKSVILTPQQVKHCHLSKSLSVIYRYPMNFTKEQQKYIQISKIDKQQALRQFEETVLYWKNKQFFIENLVLTTQGQKLGIQFIKLLIDENDSQRIIIFLFDISLMIAKYDGGIFAITNFMNFFIQKIILQFISRSTSLCNQKIKIIPFVIKLIEQILLNLHNKIEQKEQKQNLITEITRFFRKSTIIKAISLLSLGLSYQLGKIIRSHSKDIEIQSATDQTICFQSKEIIQIASWSIRVLKICILKIPRVSQPSTQQIKGENTNQILQEQKTGSIVDSEPDINHDSNQKHKFRLKMQPSQFLSYLINCIFGVQYLSMLKTFYTTIIQFLESHQANNDNLLQKNQSSNVEDFSISWIFSQTNSNSLQNLHNSIMKINNRIKSIELKILRNNQGYYCLPQIYLYTNKRIFKQIKNRFMSSFLLTLQKGGPGSLYKRNIILNIMKKKFNQLDNTN